MRKFYIVSIILSSLIHANTVVGQKQNNVWTFGDLSGLDFNTTPVTPITSKILALFPEYPSSICDTTGALLFSTDGKDIWNKFNVKIPQAFKWPWDKVTGIITLFCPVPGSDSLFYLFGTNDSHLDYIMLDKSLGFGNGDIVYPPADPKNYSVLVQANASLLLAGTQHCNKKDYWIVTYSGNTLNSFLVTSTGVSTTPVTSIMPPGFVASKKTNKGNIKFSVNGEKLVFPLIDKGLMVVADFNNNTGVFSNPIQLKVPAEHRLQDVELSPDASKLYFGTERYDDELEVGLNDVFQMDLNAGSASAIESSIVTVSTFPERSRGAGHNPGVVNRNFNVGIDGRIYVNMRDGIKSCHIIQEPNEAGADCRYTIYAINFNKAVNSFNYNYIRSASFSPKENGIVVKKNNCADLPVSFSLLFKNMDSVRWDFGDAASGAQNFSTDFATEHSYPGAGTYTVKAILHHRCFTDTATTQVTLIEDKTIKIPDVLKDTVLCVGQLFAADVTNPAATSYFWDDGDTLPKKTFKYPGTYTLQMKNVCSIDRKNFKITYEECDCKVFVPNAFTPNNDGVNDIYRPVVKCAVNEYSFKVFNRYGNIVFSTNDIKKGWTGYVNNTPGVTGTYVCLIRYKDPNSRQWITKKEFIELVR